MKIWTIGHSNHPIEYFLSMLTSESIELLADVRRFPGSRRQPQFGQQELTQSLNDVGIGYLHFPSLGGRRSGRLEDSPNGAWRVESFNAYADYMLSAEFHEALDQLQEIAAQQRTAMMCSEAVPWRCHRRLIGDALLVRDWAVLDIFSPGRTKPHELTKFARVDGSRVTYPAPDDRDTPD